MKTLKTIIIALLILFLLAAGAWMLLSRDSAAPIMPSILNEEIPDCGETVTACADGVMSGIYTQKAETENGEKLRELFIKAADCVVSGTEQNKKTAQAALTYLNLDTELLKAEIMPVMEAKLNAAVSAARLPSEIYDENDEYRRDMLEAMLLEALEGVETVNCLHEGTAYLELSYNKDSGWTVNNPDATDGVFEADFDSICDELIRDCAATIPHPEFHYSVEQGALAGPVPNQDNFGSTDDPAVITALLSDPRAKKLIGDDKTAWNENIEFLPDSVINYYLDDTILMLQWQENTDDCCGTYSEIFIADASQLRRKFAGDAFGNMEFNYATVFAQQTNSVIAFGGDLYNHGRACGVVVYGGEIYRFEPNTCDTLYFDRDGNMIFSRRWELSEQAQAQAIVDENGVDFSLCFGPVLIDKGEDVTPDMYNWGEINDTYARSAIGMLGELHYFVGNLNCFYNTPHTLATLQQMTDAMLAHGCYDAYALDGGQTAETVVNGVMMNPVQFGVERPVSDIIYFCTAIPDDMA